MSCEYQTRCLSKIHATCQCDRNLWAKVEHGSVDTFIIGHVNTRRGLKHISRLRKCMARIAWLVANLYWRPKTLSYPFWRWIFIQDGCFMDILTFFGDNNSATSLVNEWRMAIASVFIRRIPILTPRCSKICVNSRPTLEHPKACVCWIPPQSWHCVQQNKEKEVNFLQSWCLLRRLFLLFPSKAMAFLAINLIYGPSIALSARWNQIWRTTGAKAERGGNGLRGQLKNGQRGWLYWFFFVLKTLLNDPWKGGEKISLLCTFDMNTTNRKIIFLSWYPDFPLMPWF